MKTSIWGLLLVAGLSATNPILPTQAPLLSFEEAANLALELYNKKSGEKWTFELLEASPESEWDPTSPKPQHFNMKIKATCQLKDTDSEKQCDLPDGGVVEQCSGSYFLEEQPPVAVVSCEKLKDGTTQRKRAKRFILSGTFINTNVIVVAGCVRHHYYYPYYG